MTDTQTPERIWATYNDALGFPMWEGGSVTIYEQPQDGRYVEFVNADLHAAVVAERDQLKAALENIMRHRPDVKTRILAAKALEKNDG